MSKQQKEARASNEDPINFTCGGCRKVQPYDKDNHLVCPDCKYGKKQG